MNSFSAIWGNSVSVLFPLLLNLSFQISVIFVLIFLCIRLFKIRNAPVRHLLWLMVLSSSLVLIPLDLFVPGLSFRFAQSANLVEYNLPISISVDATVSKPSAMFMNLPEILVLLWMAGMLAFFSRLVYAGFLRYRLLKSSVKVKTGIAKKKLANLMTLMGINTDVRLFASERLPIPASFGFLRPLIVLPAYLLDMLPESQLEMILIHELAHIKRHDYLINLCQQILRAIFFFHPLFHFASRQLDRAREEICDDWVVQLTENRVSYADCLVQTLEMGLTPIVFTMDFLSGSFKDISRRIDRILKGGKKMQFKHPPKFYFLIFLLLATTLTVVVLFRPEKHSAVSVRTPRERVITKKYRESEKPIVQKLKEETTRTEKARKPITQQQESLESIEETKVVTDEEIEMVEPTPDDLETDGEEDGVRASQDLEAKKKAEAMQEVEETMRKVKKTKMILKAIEDSGVMELVKEAEAFLKSIDKNVKPIDVDEVISLLEEKKREGYKVDEELLALLKFAHQEVKPLIE